MSGARPGGIASLWRTFPGSNATSSPRRFPRCSGDRTSRERHVRERRVKTWNPLRLADCCHPLRAVADYRRSPGRRRNHHPAAPGRVRLVPLGDLCRHRDEHLDVRARWAGQRTADRPSRSAQVDGRRDVGCGRRHGLALLAPEHRPVDRGLGRRRRAVARRGLPAARCDGREPLVLRPARSRRRHPWGWLLGGRAALGADHDERNRHLRVAGRDPARRDGSRHPDSTRVPDRPRPARGRRSPGVRG